MRIAKQNKVEVCISLFDVSQTKAGNRIKDFMFLFPNFLSNKKNKIRHYLTQDWNISAAPFVTSSPATLLTKIGRASCRERV